jgi:heavy metal translocating P-type ATPase
MTTMAAGAGQLAARPGRSTGEQQERRAESKILLYLIGGLLVLCSSIARISGIASAEVAQIPALVGSVLLWFGLARSAWREISKANLGSSTLAALAVLASIASANYETAGYVALVLLLFDEGLTRTAWGARRAIEQLVGLTPDTARLVGSDGSDQTVPLGQIAVGQIVRVRAGENLPVDGTVTAGESTINQASLTGEALPVEVEPGATVYAGTTNLTGQIDLRVTNIGADTTIGKVAELIRAAESTRTHRQLMIELVARYFVPVALVVAALVWKFSAGDADRVERAISVLVVAAPVGLLIASPTAMMAAFAAAARLGIMIKQTSYLEAAADVDTMVFDKTGTLTTGRFAVARLSPAPGVDGADLLRAAATAEQSSNHPLARSIMETAKAARVQTETVKRTEEVHGKGMKVTVESGEILAGRSSWLATLSPQIRAEVTEVEKHIEGMTGVHVMRSGRYLGAVGLEDKLRYNAKHVIDRVRDLGARSIVLLTGDRFAVAKRVGITIGVDRIEAERLPEEKHALVTEMVRQGKRVLMVGDGINDGPSLAAADVGVAMGLSGSDIATNSAGVALMTDDVGRVPFLVELARRTRAVITQNIVGSILIALVGLVLAATGNITLLVAAFYYPIGAIFVIANSFRLVRFAEEFSAAENLPAAGATAAA